MIDFQKKKVWLQLICLGFSSGLPLPLTFAVLSFWMAESGIDKATVGFLSVASLPYALKFIWAPYLDAKGILGMQGLGQRRQWILFSQLIIFISLFAISQLSITINLIAIAAWTACLAFFSATQDIAIDAYRIEQVPEKWAGFGAATLVLGYRIGALFSGAGALYIAAAYGWAWAYQVMAVGVGVGIFTTVLLPEKPTEVQYSSLKQAVVQPFRQFLSRQNWKLLLFLILSFKLGEAFAMTMLAPFALELGFSKTQFATITKVYGTGATLLGTFVGGWMIVRYAAQKSLYVAGILQLLTLLMLAYQAMIGYSLALFTVVIVLESFSAGMTTSIFVAYLSGLCQKGCVATQYALFSALSSLGRTLFSGLAGVVAMKLTWGMFFLFCSALCLPGLYCLSLLGAETEFPE